MFRSAAMRQALAVVVPLMAWQIAAKSARDSLFLAQFSPAALPAITAVSAGLSVLMALASSRALVRFGPSRFLPAVFVAGGLLHAAQLWLLGTAPQVVSVLIYLQVSALGSILISGFWSVAGERFDIREAKSRFAQIAAAGTLSSLAGGLLAERLARGGNPIQLLAALAALQLFSAWMLARFAATAQGQPAQAAASLPEVISGAPYLARFASLIVLLAIAAGLVDYAFKAQAVAHWGRGPALGRFFALYYAGTAVATFLLQAGVAGACLRRVGPGKTAFALPAALTGFASATVFIPGLAAATLARAAEQVLRGSLFRAGYEQFYAPMPQSERRAAKLIIDVGAERCGDGLSAALLQLLIGLPQAVAGTVIGAIAAACAAAAGFVALRMDRSYALLLEKGLAAQQVALRPEEAEDPLTRTVLMRTQLTGLTKQAGLTEQAWAKSPAILPDETLTLLGELRSASMARVRAALHATHHLEPVAALQVIELLNDEKVARDAVALLRRHLVRTAPLLAAALQLDAMPLAVRRRAAGLLADSKSRASFDALFAQLQHEDFDLRYRCALALEKQAAETQFRPTAEAVFTLVAEEIPIAAALWRRADRTPEQDRRASRMNAYLVALLGLVLPAEPIRLAFRALRTHDTKLRGLALEYLEGALPKALAAQFAAHLEGGIMPPRATAPAKRSPDQALDELLQSSLTLARHDPADQPVE